MIFYKVVKYGVIGGIGAATVGLVLFGTDVVSYFYSSARSVQSAVKDSVPLEFEIQRARDMTEQIVPELQANIRLIAEEEVEVASLQKDIQDSDQRLTKQKQRLSALRQQVQTLPVSTMVGPSDDQREQSVQELADQFAFYKEAEDILAGKRRLLQTRQASLAAAMQTLAKTRREKQRIEQQIESLQAQYRLAQAASVGSRMSLDDTQLARTQKLIDRIKKRLDVAERVMAHEAQFVQPMVIEQPVDEAELMAELQQHFDGPQPPEAEAAPLGQVSDARDAGVGQSQGAMR